MYRKKAKPLADSYVVISPSDNTVPVCYSGTTLSADKSFYGKTTSLQETANFYRGQSVGTKVHLEQLYVIWKVGIYFRSYPLML